MRVRALAALALSSALALRCGGAPPRSADEERVRAVVNGILEADNSRDLPRVLGHYADDAVLLPPGDVPVRGRAAIRPRYESLFEAFTPEIVGEIEEIRVDRDTCTVVGRNRGRLVPRGNGEVRDLDDAYLMVLARRGDGWVISRLMWHRASPPG